MSKSSKRKRAEEEGRFQHPGEEKTRYACPFPGCGRPFTMEEGKPNACNEHRKLIDDVVFILGHLKSQETEPKENEPFILVPKPGMTKQAIQEALKNSQGGLKP